MPTMLVCPAMGRKSAKKVEDGRGRYCILVTQGFPEYHAVTKPGFRGFVALLNAIKKSTVRRGESGVEELV